MINAGIILEWVKSVYFSLQQIDREIIRSLKKIKTDKILYS